MCGAECSGLGPLPAPSHLPWGFGPRGYLFWDLSQQGRHGKGLSVTELFAREGFYASGCFSPVPTYWGQVVHSHAPLHSWPRAELTLCWLYAVLSSNVWDPATVILWKKLHWHFLCTSQAPPGKMEGRLRNRVAKGFQHLARLQEVCGWVMWVKHFLSSLRVNLWRSFTPG